MNEPLSPTVSKQPVISTPLQETDSRMYPSPKDRTTRPRVIKLRRLVKTVTNQTHTDSMVINESVTATDAKSSKAGSVSEENCNLVEEISSPRVHKDKITWP